MTIITSSIGLVLKCCSINSQLWPAVNSFWAALLPLLPSPHCSTYPYIVDPFMQSLYNIIMLLLALCHWRTSQNYTYLQCSPTFLYIQSTVCICHFMPANYLHMHCSVQTHTYIRERTLCILHSQFLLQTEHDFQQTELCTLKARGRRQEPPCGRVGNAK